MAETQPSAAIVWNEKGSRFETEDGKAFLEYRLRKLQGADVVMDMVHTYVPSSKRGQGTAAQLCAAAFHHAKERSIPVIPTCSYISVSFSILRPSLFEIIFRPIN